MRQIRRGTTPTHSFTTNVDLTNASVIYVTYSQFGQTVIEENKNNMTVSSTGISVPLTQQDTLKIKAGARTSVQIRAGLANGRRIASNIIYLLVKDVLKEEEI